MATTKPNRGTANDGSTDNDNYIKNDSGCCVYVPLPESPCTEVDVKCDDTCDAPPSNPCGLTHPDGSGTLAGCKSTTLPHFGVIMNKRPGTCRQFGYYTSGNTEEYENECGSIDKLSHTVKVKPCATETTYTTESCDCFEEKATNAVQKTAIAGNKAASTKNTADIAANHP